MASTTHPPAAAAAHSKHETSPGKLVLNWAVLCGLTFATFGFSQLNMSPGGHLAAALCISTIKVTLVVLIFMHLWHGEGVNRIVFVTSFVFLLVLMFFVMADVETRFTLSNSRIPPMPKIDQKMMPTGMPPGMSDGPSSGEAGQK
ncbi:MAG TPA: cytochrome C oxidase subunit IV family protein [Myxococcaceae bacterium]|nr:cytochrome C oxidase subunit IV family protein [Myxococcaceae bacterium]